MSFRIFFAAFLSLFANFSATTALADCASEAGSCEVPLGTYEILLPSNVENAPVVVHLHGYGGTGMGVLGQSRRTKALLERGYAVIAPNGLSRGGSGPNSWNFHPKSNSGRDEIAFYDEVISDAVERFGLNRERVLLSGFSIGASMTHYVACNAPDLFTAYAPVAGSFWRPHPIECAGPVQMFHTHGWKDGTFPLEGRRVGSGFVQGDAFETMSIWRKANECRQPRAKVFSKTGQFMRRAWTECKSGTALEFALFDGGHAVPSGWADMVVDWFENTPIN
jgi:polyhydroxybutyrate depolymerase